ncbi:hypothetical protein CAS74_002613 [Pichia kudriavzevii]|uniref:Ras-related protein Rab-5B n=1 Tax=Pichia kudriavzevii TaxID=4909 RepID=A0A099NYI3_PICKU|nr:uncharacterized protein C5L36_0D06350 [Pichia kudriavzevii]AWU77909.1 hypothetical protein C5L36_0D06350 [Pichia kudriavzevii]KGK37868.1 hypothetical protein JL09_g3020 [Pichia kudriavzevii]ONH75262.1 Ras-related protein Rab-5B [Pichia kudriavzevii]OUT22867.1 hypothetical protein CAS74_002613 [Pichia kudriavzevii]
MAQVQKPRLAQFKLVLLGESAVGKSSIVQRFVKNSFDELRESTIGAAFMTQSVKLTPQEIGEGDGDGVTIKFEIWDTAGQERYRSLASMYYRNAQAALVVYDITHPDSLNKAKYWIRELQKQANSDILIALVGNKKDLEDQRKISNDDVVSLANEFNLLHFQVSAKTGENVNEMFKAIAMKMPYQFQLAKGKNSTNKFADGSNGNPIDLSKRPSTNEQDCAC